MKKEERWYANLISETIPKPKYLESALRAFLAGGFVALIGQGITDMYRLIFNLSFSQASNPAATTMIFIASLLTGLGVFDNLVKYCGAGILVPVTGFANSVSSSALEFKREGFIAGIGSKMFILAGSVITFGVVTAFIIGLIYAVFVF